MSATNGTWLPSGARVSILTLVIFLVGVWSLALYANVMLHNDMEQLLGAQQVSTVAVVAADLNDELGGRLQALEKTAAQITPAILGNTSAIQAFLEWHPAVADLFNAGFFVTRLDGNPIADFPPSAGRLGLNVKSRDYMIAALKEGKASIGSPVLGKSLKTPVFSIAAPIRDANGLVSGALVGVTNLSKANFIDNITAQRYGKNGGYLIVAPQLRQIITATDKKHIMEKLPAPGVHPFIDRALQGFEGSAITTTPQGVQVLASTKGIPVAGWHVVALLPTAEAFAPLVSMQRRLMLAAFLLTLLASGLVWWFIRVQQAKGALEEQAVEQAEELLRSEQRFRSFVENVNDVLFALTPEGIFSYVSPQWHTAFGYEISETIGQPFLPFVHPDDVPGCLALLQQVIETGERDSGVEYRVRCKDGSYLWYRANASLMIDPAHGRKLLVGIGRDITEAKLSEEKLRQFNEVLDMRVFERTVELQETLSRIDQLSEQSGTMIWEVDSQGLYTYVNHMSEAVFGYQPHEMVGRMYFYDLFPESERETIKKTVSGIFERKDQIVNFENSTLTKDGHQLWWVTNAVPLLSNDGILLGYRGSDTDITESKKLKEQLQQSQKMEAVGQLAGGLAHDFNNVLSIINGYCCLLQMDVEQNEKLKEYIERILAASYRAGELTHSMLAFSRTQVMNPQNQNLNGIVAKIGSFIEKIIGENIQFKIVVKDATLPVFVDGGQIEQILINLANNARDAMPNGGELAIVTEMIRMDDTFITENGFGTAGQYAVITVSDTGTGMDEATRKKIFEPFFTTKSVDKGTGLGLAMVYGITKQHNGFVDATSIPGHGSRFVVYLPIVTTAAATDSVKSVNGMDTPTGTETIMIAEDNADLREFMRNILAKLGYRVIVAADGQEAVDMFRENIDTIQLIIMDMIMPNKSGKVAYDEILQLKPDTRALFSSGYSAKIIQQQGELGEYAEFISKPVQPAAFLIKVRDILDR